MRKLFFSLFLAALAFTSCEWLETDVFGGGDGKSEEDRFWSVVGQLVDVKDITEDYKGKTFQPAIGSPDGGDESARVVAVNSLEAAVYRYNNLTGADINENTQTHTFKDKAIGTLTWNKSSDNTCWATVDVSIPSVPGLQKIIYRSPEQGDVNGSVGDNGSAYYRFGDVIERYRSDDGTTEYWICIRPSFGPEGKEKSHWVCVSPLPKENVWPYNDGKDTPFVASNGFNYSLPDDLRSDPEWYQDLAEMLFAIMYPTDWSNNITSYSSVNILGNPSGLPIFNDFHCTNINLHNIYFWQNVQKQWKEKGLVQKIFGITYDEMAKALNPDPANPGRGLHFLYDTFSWSTRFSNKPKLYQIHYTHGTKDTQKNMHLQTKSAPCSQVVVPNNKTEGNTNFPFDFYQLNYERVPYMKEARFFGDDAPRWTIRYAVGKELSTSGKYDAQQPIPGFDDNHEVYRYYRDVLQKNLTDAPEETKKPSDQPGLANMQYGFLQAGTVIQDENGINWVCYAGWVDQPGMYVTKDRKARFFTTKGAATSYLTTDNGNGILFTTDLPKENEAENLVFMLLQASKDNYGEIYKSCQEYLDLDLRRYAVYRDTTMTHKSGVVIDGQGMSMNIPYEPAGGWTSPSQPYLRFIYDSTYSGEGRTRLPQEMQYVGGHYYTRYNDSRADLMDLVHCLSAGNYVTADRPIPSDKWSRCKRHDTGTRDGNYTVNNLTKKSYIDVSDFIYDPKKNTNAYFEPVLFVRYLELDDDALSFKGTYNGKSYSLIYSPNKGKKDLILRDVTTTATVFGMIYNRPNSENHIWCTKNNQPYTPDLFKENMFW